MKDEIINVIMKALGFYRRNLTYSSYWYNPNAKRTVVLMRKNILLHPDIHGKYPLSDDEQNYLDKVIDWFEEGMIDDINIQGREIYERIIADYDDLRIVIKRTSLLPPSGDFYTLYNKVDAKYPNGFCAFKFEETEDNIRKWYKIITSN